MSETEALTWLGGALSTLGVWAEALRGDGRSVLLRSTLGLPFYAAGIMQWFLFGVSTRDPALLATCGLQLPALALLLSRYWRARVPA